MLNELPMFPVDHLPLFGEPTAIALTIRDRNISYQELNLRIGRLAAFLALQGLSAGDRVATWLGKSEVACLMPLAAVRAALIHVPINPLLKAAQVAHIMADSGARLLITNGARALSLKGDSGTQSYKPPHPELVSWSDLLAARSEVGKHAQHDGASFDIIDDMTLVQILDDPGAPVLDPLPSATSPDTLAAILYTSGSTGRPKGVMLSHSNLAIGAAIVAQYLKLGPDDTTLAVLPLSFDYGQNQLFSTWRAGGRVVPLDFLTPRDVIKACIRHRVTTLAAVPPLWVQLTEQEWPAQACHDMRRLTNSGGALTPKLVKMLRSIFGRRTDIYAMYGLTEAFRSTYLDPASIDANPTSMGRAVPYAEIMVVAPDGSEAAPDEPGELVHAGPLVAQGYWRDPQRTAERFRPAPAFSSYGGTAVWSGDTVRCDADGLLTFVGRDDAMIKTNGNRVSPTEIEEAALESGQVAEACAIGRKDDRSGEVIILLVRGAGDDAALKAYLKSVLPNFMQPTEVIWLDVFPTNANGKLDRNLLVSGLSA